MERMVFAGMSSAELIWWLKHMEMRAAQLGGAIEEWRTRMKQAEMPGAYCAAAQRIEQLYEYLDRCEMDIAELYILLEEKGLTT